MSSDRLFTPHFFVMCGFTFTVFLSAFQLLPTAPFHILDLGGSTFASGLFLGFLTYSSAISAPLTGALADRMGQRTILIVSSLALAAFSLGYAIIPSYRVVLFLVIVHGIFWSGLLSASASYMTSLLPENRRAEGIGYWGLSTVAAMAVAPSVGLWIYKHGGWVSLCAVGAALNLIMAAIAWNLRRPAVANGSPKRSRGLLEWRVLVTSVSLFLYSFGYGGITSFTALYADANGVTPKSIYLTALAITILLTRPFAGRLGDRWGYKRMFVPCLVMISLGLALLSVDGTRSWMVASAIVFGVGFGTAYPVYVGYVMQGIDPDRRGAAFGAILAAFDTGVGSGSTVMGWLIQRFGFSTAFATAACLSALALPYFLAVDQLFRGAPSQNPNLAPTSSFRDGPADVG
ncbi:MAG TPA: MFS transporter [Vicinamibacterales bacterium]|jgi:MFS family permease